MSDNNKKIHPIIEKALQLAHSEGEKIQFSDEAVNEMKQLLKQYFGKPTLPLAIIELLKLSNVLNDQGHESAALAIIVVVCSAADAMKELSAKGIGLPSGIKMPSNDSEEAGPNAPEKP